jgi:hypothetical protein
MLAAAPLPAPNAVLAPWPPIYLPSLTLENQDSALQRTAEDFEISWRSWYSHTRSSPPGLQGKAAAVGLGFFYF